MCIATKALESRQRLVLPPTTLPLTASCVQLELVKDLAVDLKKHNKTISGWQTSESSTLTSSSSSLTLETISTEFHQTQSDCDSEPFIQEVENDDDDAFDLAPVFLPNYSEGGEPEVAPPQGLAAVCDPSCRQTTKGVRFSSIQLREYPIILGDNPGGTGDGPPVTIDWEYQYVFEASVDEWEAAKDSQCPRRHQDMHLSRLQREYLLTRDYSLRDFMTVIHSVRKIQCQRFVSAQDKLWWHSMNESLIKHCRLFKHHDKNDLALLWLKRYRRQHHHICPSA